MTLKTIFAPSLYARICCLVLFFVAASASFNGFYVKWQFNESNPADGFEYIVDGTASRPYVYRQLLPAITRTLDHLAPAEMKQRLYLYYLSHRSISGAVVWSQIYFFRDLSLYGITFIFALLAVFAMHLVCRQLKVHSAASVLAPAIFILILPYFMHGGGLYYDYSELAFISLAVWCAWKFEWWYLLPLAVLGTWNKESFFFVLITLYPFFRLRHSRVKALFGVGALCLTSGSVYLPIHQHFAHNPGGTVYHRWVAQGQAFMHPLSLISSVDKTYGIYTVSISSLIPLFLIVWTVWRVWPRLPGSIQLYGKIAASINFPLYLFFCAPGELRNLSMLYIVLLLALALNLDEWIRSGALSVQRASPVPELQ